MIRQRRVGLGVNDPQILIANALVNLDPTSIVTSGSNVTGWNNIGTGGSGHNLTTATAAGTIVTSTLNGRTVPQSAGVGYMTVDVEPDLSQPNTIIFVAKPSVDPTSFRLPICDGFDGAGEQHLIQSLETTGFPQIFSGSSVNANFAIDQNTRVWSVAFNGASSYVDVDGLGRSTGNPGSDTYSFGILFADAFGPANIYRGQIGQFLVFNYLLSENQHASVVKFLKAKFAAS